MDCFLVCLVKKQRGWKFGFDSMKPVAKNRFGIWLSLGLVCSYYTLKTLHETSTNFGRYWEKIPHKEHNMVYVNMMWIPAFSYHNDTSSINLHDQQEPVLNGHIFCTTYLTTLLTFNVYDTQFWSYITTIYINITV